MSNVDIILVAGFVFLILVVIVRIGIGRKNAVQSDPSIKIKKPETAKKSVSELTKNQKSVDFSSEKNASEDLINNQKADESKLSSDENLVEGSDETINEMEFSQQHDSVEAKENHPIPDPLVLIKTFSAPTEKRINAIKIAAETAMIEAVPALIEALYEPDSSISLAAAEALGQIGDERAIEPLLEISRRNDAQLMRDIADSIDVEKSEDDNAKLEESVENGQDKPYNFKEMVVFKIDQLPKEYFQKDGTPIPRKELVVKGLKDNNQQLRQMAAKVAIGLEGEEIVEPLIEALENPYEVESVRFMAAEALGGMNDDRSVDSLLKALQDENVAVRYSAAASLSGKKDDRIINALIKAIKDPDKFVRSSVAYALGATTDLKAMEALFDCMTDESEVVRFSAAKALACFDSDLVVEETRKRLEIADSNTIPFLIELLGHVDAPDSIQILRQYLDNENIEVSYKASMALMGCENLEIIDELVEASKRFDQELFNLARKNFAEYNNSSSKIVEKKVSEKKADKDLTAQMLKFKEMLADENPNTRGSAAGTLGESDDSAAIDLLLESLNDENEFVRATVVASLGKISDDSSLPSLLKLVNDSSEEVRYALVKALQNFDVEKTLQSLEKLSKSDASSQIRRAARSAIEKQKA
jgi:HEAT repeat protein